MSERVTLDRAVVEQVAMWLTEAAPGCKPKVLREGVASCAAALRDALRGAEPEQVLDARDPGTEVRRG